MKKSDTTLCWNCKNAYANKCSWFKNYKPVKNWVATPTKINGYMKNGEPYSYDSFKIVKCPNFISDKNEEEVTNKKLAESMNMSLRTYYRKNRNLKEKSL